MLGPLYHQPPEPHGCSTFVAERRLILEAGPARRSPVSRLHVLAVEPRVLHLGDRQLPVRRIFSIKWLISEQPPNPPPNYNCKPVAKGGADPDRPRLRY